MSEISYEISNVPGKELSKDVNTNDIYRNK